MPRVLPGPNGWDWWILTVALTLFVRSAGATGAHVVDTRRPRAGRWGDGAGPGDHSVRRAVRQSLRRLRPERRGVLRADRSRSRRGARAGAWRTRARPRC